MNNIIRIFILFGLLIVTTYVMAQLPEKALEVPIKYITPEENLSLSLDENRRPGSIWIVYSDKEGNKTFDNKSGKQVKNTIKFMDDFYVAEETQDRVKLVKDPAYKTGFSSEARDFGWIDKENLLLWDHCLITKKGKINKKGMVLNTVESIKKDKIVQGDEDMVRYFLDKELTIQSPRTSKVYEILYVYKVTDEAILLGKNYVTEKTFVNEEIFGWVPIRKITIWDHRIAIEPNWNKEATEERIKKNIKATFFIDEPRANRFGDGNQISNRYVIWNNDSYANRNIGDWRRFPLLEYNKETQIILAGVMGKLRSILDENDTIGTPVLAEIKRKYNELRAKQRKINIVFVVDGTTSMGPYFPAIANAIGTSMERLTKNYTKNDLHFGVVVYRDYAEGEMITQVKRLNSNYREVTQWLSRIRAIDKFDKDQPEAVNFGLITALKSTGFQQNETNVIILVGDAANHHRNDQSKVNSSDIIYQLFKYDCNFLAFQVHNESNAAYDEFEPQIKEIIHSTAMRKYNQNKEIAEKIAKQTNFKMSSPRFIRAGINTFILDTATMIGTVVLAPKGKPITPQQLQDEIDRTILFSSELTERKLSMLEKMIQEGEGWGNATSENESSDYYGDNLAKYSQTSYSPALIDFLRKMGVPESKLKIILSENYQLYVPAYSTMRVKGLSYPLYNQVLFMTLLELGDLLIKIDALADATTASGQRENLKRVWLELLQSHLGDEMSKEQAENLTFERINEKVFGLPGTSNLLNVRLADITNPSVVNDEQFYLYVTGIMNKRKQLYEIYNDGNYQYGFYSYDTRYFWISQDLLP